MATPCFNSDLRQLAASHSNPRSPLTTSHTGPEPSRGPVHDQAIHASSSQLEPVAWMVRVSGAPAVTSWASELTVRLDGRLCPSGWDGHAGGPRRARSAG